MPVDIQKLNSRYEQLRAERSGWDHTWKSLAELFAPTRWRSDTDETTYKQATDNRLINSAGILAMRTLAAGIQGGMTSPARPWFRLIPAEFGNETANFGVNAWLDKVTNLMQSVLHQSNFYNSIHGLYADLGTFGTGLMIETADADGLHFDLVRAGEYVIDTNGHGEVDTFFRRIFMTPRQIVDCWGNNVPQHIQTEADKGSTRRFNIIHGVFPRTDIRAGSSADYASKPFCSVYFLPGMTHGPSSASGTILDEGGFNMFPAFAPRWDVNGTDVYGRSPAMDVAPDCQMLQAMTSTLREMQHKIADPPLVVDSSLKAFGVRLSPASLTYVDTTRSGITPVAPIHQPDAQALNYTMQAVQGVEHNIQSGLYTDLFRMLIDNERKQITATEIQIKQQEKMILIGPVVERMQKELLEPLIKRTYGLMEEWGVLPEPPGVSKPLSFEVTFESVLAQAQKIATTSSIEQGVSFVASLAGANPDVADILNFDETGRAYLERIGMPERCLRDAAEVLALRKQRAQAQQQAAEQQAVQQQVQQMGDVSNVVKNLGQAPTGADGQTVLGAILGGLGGV